jgi:flagellar biosynthesis anti-sigma factor FlgM
MRINPSVSASAIARYDNAIRQKNSVQPGLSTEDKVELSDRAQTYAKMVKAAMDSEDVSDTRVHAVMNRIASGSYTIDVDKIAEKMLGFGE